MHMSRFIGNLLLQDHFILTGVLPAIQLLSVVFQTVLQSHSPVGLILFTRGRKHGS